MGVEKDKRKLMYEELGSFLGAAIITKDRNLALRSYDPNGGY